jgi:hypothetical protein
MVYESRDAFDLSETCHLFQYKLLDLMRGERPAVLSENSIRLDSHRKGRIRHCQTNLSGPAKGAGLRAFRPPVDATRPTRRSAAA